MPTKALLIAAAFVTASQPTEPLATPGFHHLHLNSMNPELAIAFYSKAFPTTSKVMWGGQPALK